MTGCRTIAASCLIWRWNRGEERRAVGKVGSVRRLHVDRRPSDSVALELEDSLAAQPSSAASTFLTVASWDVRTKALLMLGEASQE